MSLVVEAEWLDIKPSLSYVQSCRSLPTRMPWFQDVLFNLLLILKDASQLCWFSPAPQIPRRHWGWLETPCWCLFPLCISPGHDLFRIPFWHTQFLRMVVDQKGNLWLDGFSNTFCSWHVCSWLGRGVGSVWMENGDHGDNCCKCLLNAYWAPGNVLGVYQIVTHLIRPMTSWGRFFYGPHFTDKETQAQKVSIPTGSLST